MKISSTVIGSKSRVYSLVAKNYIVSSPKIHFIFFIDMRHSIYNVNYTGGWEFLQFLAK